MKGKHLRVHHLRVFESHAWSHVAKKKRKKWTLRVKRVFVIHCYENSLYKDWINSKKCPVISRHVRILENSFPTDGWYEAFVSIPLVFGDEECNHSVSRTTAQTLPHSVTGTANIEKPGGER